MSDAPVIELQGAQIPVRLRPNARARKIVLRYDPSRDEVRVTVPKQISNRKALAFAAENVGWLESERAKAPPLVRLAHGSVITLEGEDVTLVFDPDMKRGVLIGDGTLTVGGPAEHAPARLLRWLKALAKTRLAHFAAAHATRLGTSYSRISIGDMRSRWGSCSGHGTLRFNWRLVMATPAVMDYVAAHEVAHLLEMNHSPAFWAHVESGVADWKTHRNWLRSEGNRLFAVQL